MTEQDGLRAAAREAWLYTLPLIEVATTRTREAGRGAVPNQFSHVRTLADHRMRLVTTPNNDTLYSSAQLDLGAGPIMLTIPPAGDRYLSVALMDAYTNNFVILGTRTTGPDGGRFRLVGPNDAAEGPDVVRSPTRHVWMLARVLVDGPDDLEAARAVQAGLSIQGPPGDPFVQEARRSAPWQEYFASADRLLALDPPPVTDRALLRRIAPLGLGEGRFDAAAFSAEEEAAIAAGVAEAQGLLRRAGGLAANGTEGWSYPDPTLGDFGQSYIYRAAVAVAGLAALPPAEAMYMRAIGEAGPLFDGNRDWVLHFPPDRLIPVDSFWSLSLYEATEDGNFFFTENPLGRFAIGDRTPGLKHDADGGLTLRIGHRQPEDASNWLPAPAGPFALFMRAYLPQRALLTGQYRLPAVVEAD